MRNPCTNRAFQDLRWTLDLKLLFESELAIHPTKCNWIHPPDCPFSSHPRVSPSCHWSLHLLAWQAAGELKCLFSKCGLLTTCVRIRTIWGYVECRFFRHNPRVTIRISGDKESAFLQVPQEIRTSLKFENHFLELNLLSFSLNNIETTT